MINVTKERICFEIFVDECFYAKYGIVENNLRILYLCRTPETDSTNPWGSIEPRLRTTAEVPTYDDSRAKIASWDDPLVFNLVIVITVNRVQK